MGSSAEHGSSNGRNSGFRALARTIHKRFRAECLSLHPTTPHRATPVSPRRQSLCEICRDEGGYRRRYFRKSTSGKDLASETSCRYERAGCSRRSLDQKYFGHRVSPRLWHAALDRVRKSGSARATKCFCRSPRDRQDHRVGINQFTSNLGAAVFTDYQFGSVPYLLGGMAEYLSSVGLSNWFLGARSCGAGFELTPTWQYKYLFACASAGYLHLLTAPNGGYGNDGVNAMLSRVHWRVASFSDVNFDQMQQIARTLVVAGIYALKCTVGRRQAPSDLRNCLAGTL